MAPDCLVNRYEGIKVSEREANLSITVRSGPNRRSGSSMRILKRRLSDKRVDRTPSPVAEQGRYARTNQVHILFGNDVRAINAPSYLHIERPLEWLHSNLVVVWV